MSNDKNPKQEAIDFTDMQLKQGNTDIADIAYKFAEKKTAPLKVRIAELEDVPVMPPPVETPIENQEKEESTTTEGVSNDAPEEETN